MVKLGTNRSGFTLVELMIVVVIIGILAALAIPRFMATTTKTKQSEAKAIIKQIYVNERTYRQQTGNNSYYFPAGPASAGSPSALSAIWIEIMPTALYTYTVVAVGDGFLARATANIDDDAVVDEWTIDDSGILTCVTNDVTAE
ncbi:MAG: prepilin-type N-terminal cleavage/methylation domain-containing protein [Planctomycetota bacterium]